ncbi:hypothetical protein SAMN03159343_0865 [Klenkia marina]|uniref:DUF4352 domain-containing protein n=1 Tax=Klenkia marina TaxID=1960309 RepID=A0A1G4XH66_9ACTN|nr:hypothetical protein [Klenkia marina]SCX40038.1 hypothetical protein SAMN03159343_0865 [Klenkia marina]
MSSPTSTTRRPSRRLLVVVGAVVVVLVAVALFLSTRGGDGQDDAAAPATTVPGDPVGSEPAPTNPPTPAPTGPTADATDLPPTAPAVGLSDEAAVGDGVTGRLVSIEAVQGDGEGVGNVDGPSILVTVELVNGTDAPVSFDAVAAEAYTGAALTPATLLDDPQASPLRGTVDPGGSVTGSYVFYVPETDRGDVTIQVGYQAGAPYLVWRGSVS